MVGYGERTTLGLPSMTKEPPADAPARAKVRAYPILNPRYAGATPEMVGRALLRRDPEADDEEDESEESGIIDDPKVRSSI